VEFVVTQTEAQRLIERVSQEKAHAVYAVIPARFGVIGGDTV
jgi:predicted house-cleaning NTP pyrophosphatase (Maf/HAM1 superfamily)